MKAPSSQVPQDFKDAATKRFDPAIISVLLLCLAGFLLSIVILFPADIWADNDYAREILANACNASARLADRVLYPALMMGYHPGVPVYLLSGLISLVAMGGKVGSDLAFFDQLIDRAGFIYAGSKLAVVTITVGSVALFIAWTRRLAPLWVIIVGLALWFTSAPAVLIQSVLLATETFGLLLNGMLVACTMLLVSEPRRLRPYLLSGLVAAFAYLVKLSFIFVYGALLLAILAAAFAVRLRWKDLILYLAAYNAIAIGIAYATGYWLIRGEAFSHLIDFHLSAFQPSSSNFGDRLGLAQMQVNLFQSWQHGASAVVVALFGGTAVLIYGLYLSIARRESPRVSVPAVVAGAASIASALPVVVRYTPSYVAATSGTLPFLVIAAWQMSSSRFLRYLTIGAAAILAVVFAPRSFGDALARFQWLSARTQDAALDMQELDRLVDANATRGLFNYQVATRFFGEGFAVHYCTHPVHAAYASSLRPRKSSFGDEEGTGFDYFVVDKLYFPTLEQVKTSKYLDPIKIPSSQHTYKPSDRIVELKTMWILIRGHADSAN
jgi:hypothetical protein